MLGVGLLAGLPDASAQSVAAAPASQPAPAVDFAGAKVSADARYMGRWISDLADNQGMPFVIVDKKDAHIYVFDAAGKLVGHSAALLGLQPGDHSVQGIGQRALSQIQPWERTTPSGRFVSVPGRNLTGEQVIWIDHSQGLAIHRIRTNSPHERRPQRLASATPDDNRISMGCVVVSLEFFENVVNATLGKTHAVIYVLPETRAVSEVFGLH